MFNLINLTERVSTRANAEFNLSYVGLAYAKSHIITAYWPIHRRPINLTSSHRNGRLRISCMVIFRIFMTFTFGYFMTYNLQVGP